MTPGWIIALILLLALSSLYQVMPNARQRQQARLRASASQLGLRVRLVLKSQVKDPRYPWQAQLVSYLLPWPDKATLQKVASAELGGLLLVKAPPQAEDLPGLTLIGSKSRLKQADIDVIRKKAAVLPAAVIAIEINAEGCSVHWTECGGDNSPEAIKSFLLEIQQYLATI